MFLDHDEADAVGAATAAWVILVTLNVKAVVKGELFAFFDFTQGIDINTAPDDPGLTIRVTGVIDQACCVPRHITIDVPLVIQGENIDRGITVFFMLCILIPGTVFTDRLINRLANILDHFGFLWDVLGCINSPAMDFRATHRTPITLGALVEFFEFADQLGFSLELFMFRHDRKMGDEM